MFSNVVRIQAAMVAAFLLGLASPSFAATVIVATMRAPAGATETGGRLYRVDVATGTSTLVGRILVDGTQPAGLTCMAVHPVTNVVYAITGGLNDATRGTLLTVDPSTGEARLIGRLTRPLSDISFDPAGRLYGWTANTGQLAVVDIETGRVSAIGAPSEPAVGGAFAIDPQGNAVVAPWAPPGTQRVDLATGAVAAGPPLSDLRDVTTLRSMAFSERGDLFGTYSIRDVHGLSALLRIDPATGKAIAIAGIPEDAEAIAVVGRDLALPEARHWIAHGLLAAILLTLAVIFFRARRGSGARSQSTSQ